MELERLQMGNNPVALVQIFIDNFDRRIIFSFSSPDEKEGLAVSHKESNRVIEEAKEREAQMQNKLKALEQQVQVLTERDHEVGAALTRRMIIIISQRESLSLWPVVRT